MRKQNQSIMTGTREKSVMESSNPYGKDTAMTNPVYHKTDTSFFQFHNTKGNKSVNGNYESPSKYSVQSSKHQGPNTSMYDPFRSSPGGYSTQHERSTNKNVTKFQQKLDISHMENPEEKDLTEDQMERKKDYDVFMDGEESDDADNPLLREAKKTSSFFM